MHIGRWRCCHRPHVHRHLVSLGRRGNLRVCHSCLCLILVAAFAHFHPSLSPVVSLSLGILHEWMTTQMLAKPCSNLLQRTEGDHWGGRTQPGWRTFMMTFLRWILGYMKLDKTSDTKSASLETDVLAQCYALVLVYATIGLDLPTCPCRQQRHAGSNTLHQQNPPVVNWRCRLTQVDLYNGRNTMAVVVVTLLLDLWVSYCCSDKHIDWVGACLSFYALIIYLTLLSMHIACRIYTLQNFIWKLLAFFLAACQ